MNNNLNPGQGQQSYVPKLEDQNIIFYSLHPKDLISKQFLEVLNKNPLLDRQFIKICVYPNFQNIRIPQKILELNKVPVLVPAGFPEPILGEDALSWLNNNAMTTDKSNGMDFASIDDNSFSAKFSSLTDEFEQSDYNQFFNNEYNLGFSEGQGNKINQAYSVNANDRITTYDNSSENKKGISDKMMMKMNQLRFERDKDVPKAQQRIGGLDMDSSSGGNTITGLMNSPMQYNPNGGMGGGGMGGGGMGGGIPQYNPNVPMMPQMPNNNRMMNQNNPMQYNPNPPRMPQMPGRNGGIQYNPNPNAPVRGGGGIPQMNLPPSNRGTMPQMPTRPFADRTAGSRHNAGNFPSPMNMPGGAHGPGTMQQAGRQSMMMGVNSGGPQPMSIGSGPAPANF